MERIIRALVLEDERPARRYLVELLEETGRVEVMAAVATTKEADAALSEDSALGIEVAFADIHIAGETRETRAGLDFVRAHSTSPNAPLFVFSTASDAHALEAWDVGASDYLQKPLSATRVQACLAKLRPRLPEHLVAPPMNRVAARTRHGLAFFALDEVDAFEADQRLVFAHTRGQRLDVDLSLTTLERAVGSRFIRVHRNWLVRLDGVSEMERTGGEGVLRMGALEVPVARDRAAQVRRALLNGTLGIRQRNGRNVTPQ